MAFPFGQLQTRRLNLLPSLLQRRQKRRSRSARPKGLGADLGNEHASSSTSGKQDLAAVCTSIDALHCTNSERLTILMFLIPTLMTVSLKTALECGQNLQCDQYCQSSVKISADKSP